MERDIEKCGASPRVCAVVHSALDALAIASVATALLGAVAVAAEASWRVAAYFSIVGTLFDIVFSYEFFARWQREERPFPWLAFVSSILPLLCVSGPFLAGWARNDLAAASVRGFWLGAPPASGLAVIAVLRLLRVVRPLHHPANQEHTRNRSSGGRPAAAAIGIAAVLAGAFAADALLIPGFATASEMHRSSAMATILAAGDDDGRISAALAAEAVALRVNGRVLIAAPDGIAPSEYAVEASGGTEAWFSVAGESRARAAAAALAALASMAAAGGYAMARRGRGGPPRGMEQERARDGGRHVEDGVCDGSAPRDRPSDRPAGTEELAGILGKRTRW